MLKPNLTVIGFLTKFDTDSNETSCLEVIHDRSDNWLEIDVHVMPVRGNREPRRVFHQDMIEMNIVDELMAVIVAALKKKNVHSFKLNDLHAFHWKALDGHNVIGWKRRLIKNAIAAVQLQP